LATITAQRILDENGWESSDVHATETTALTRVEYLIDNAVNWINLEAGTSISNISGTAGSKSLTSTANQDSVVKMLAALLVRAYLDKGPNVGLSALNVAQITTDPHYALFMKLVRKGIDNLNGTSFERV
jgi:hypothetical protein